MCASVQQSGVGAGEGYESNLTRVPQESIALTSFNAVSPGSYSGFICPIIPSGRQTKHAKSMGRE